MVRHVYFLMIKLFYYYGKFVIIKSYFSQYCFSIKARVFMKCVFAIVESIYEVCFAIVESFSFIANVFILKQNKNNYGKICYFLKYILKRLKSIYDIRNCLYDILKIEKSCLKIKFLKSTRKIQVTFKFTILEKVVVNLFLEK